MDAAVVLAQCPPGQLTQLHTACRGRVMHTPQGTQQEDPIHEPKHVGMMIVVTRVADGPIVANVGDDENDPHLQLRLGTFSRTLP